MSILDKLLRRNRKTDECNTKQRSDDKDDGTIDTQSVEMSSAIRAMYEPDPPIGTTTKATTSVSAVRRNIDPPPIYYNEVIECYAIADDIDTIIIQYSDRSMERDIKSSVRRRYKKSGESFIPPFIDIDIFVNISLNPDYIPADKYRGKRWLRVAYECLDGNNNPSAKTRFPQSIVIVMGRTLNAPKLTVDMLLEGGR